MNSLNHKPIRAVRYTCETKVVDGSSFFANPSVEVAEISPRELRPTDLLIQPLSVGICGSDLHCCRTGPDGRIEFSGPVSPPVVLGHELCGEVVAAGSAVTGVSTGQWVVAESVMPCGKCPFCISGNPNCCGATDLLGLTQDGAMAERLVLPSELCWTTPSPLALGISSEVAADLFTLIEPAACIFNALVDFRWQDLVSARVLVLGQGPMGILAASIAKAITGRAPTVIDRSQYRCGLSSRITGATSHALDITPETIGELPGLARATSLPIGSFDLIIDTAGIPSEALVTIAPLVTPGGAIVLLARVGNILEIPSDILITRRLRIIGSRGQSRVAIQQAIRHVCDHRDRLVGLITLRVTFDSVANFLLSTNYLQQGKAVLRPHGPQ